MSVSRRSFIASGTAAFGFSAAFGNSGHAHAVPSAANARPVESFLQFGLVTYLWGKDMDLPALLDVCEKSGVLGVELRTEHKHGVEPVLTKAQREDVRKRFADSPVELVGYGSNAEYHSNDPARLKANIDLTKQYIQLMHDCGATGVKVKPNGFVSEVPREQTIEQIGKALNEVAEYGQQYGQQIRVEVHGSGTQELPVMKAIFDVAVHPNAKICWNSNNEDLKGEGLEFNFNLVRDRFGDTVHVRELNDDDYPYQQLFSLLTRTNYVGWILLEARRDPADKVQALIEQRQAFEKLVAAASA